MLVCWVNWGEWGWYFDYLLCGWCFCIMRKKELVKVMVDWFWLNCCWNVNFGVGCIGCWVLLVCFGVL